MSDRPLPPQIDNAPGISWRACKWGWEARWRARRDLARRGYKPSYYRMWASTEAIPVPSETTKLWIAGRCTSYQNDMLVWGAGGIPKLAGPYDGTIRSLIDCYRTDKDSSYQKKRFATRDHYDDLCRMLDRDCGHLRVADIDARQILRWHEKWTEGGKIAMGHSLIGMLRTVMTYGKTMLTDKKHKDECKSVREDLHDITFPAPAPRREHLTADQAIAFRAMARAEGRPSMALAQALQFDLILRQKDVIGEWVPTPETVLSTYVVGEKKWLRGLRWEEIDANFVAVHMTSKRSKEITLDLKLAPMVMEELRLIKGLAPHEALRRDMFAESKGPVVVAESGIPWADTEFRRLWREVATKAGIPKTVRNMDSRAGAITEALAAGAPMDSVRKSATHSNSSMTQRYSRDDQEATAKVAQIRADFRNKTRTG